MVSEVRRPERTNFKGDSSFANVVKNNQVEVGQKSFEGLEYFTEAEVRVSLSKAYVGIVSNLGSSYIQDTFFSKGYFAIKVTPLGANMRLLEEPEDGEIHDLICDVEA